VFNDYIKHWALLMGLLIVVAVSCSLMQYFLAIDNFEWMVLVLILSTGFVFASLFAFLQVKAKHSVFHTGICGGIFALYLILLFYIRLLAKIKKRSTFCLFFIHIKKSCSTIMST
jgi:hypothetical protein